MWPTKGRTVILGHSNDNSLCSIIPCIFLWKIDFPWKNSITPMSIDRYWNLMAAHREPLPKKSENSIWFFSLNKDFFFEQSKSVHIVIESISRAQTIKDANQLCFEKHTHQIFNLFDENFTDSRIMSTISDLAPAFEDTIVLCKFFDKWADCAKLLYPMLTEYGICYSFNSLNMYEVVTDQ